MHNTGLKVKLQSTQNDTVKMYIHRQLGLYYQERNRFSAIEHYEAQLQLARMLKQKIWEAEALSRLGYVSSLIQNYPGSLNYLLAARELASDPKYEMNIWNIAVLTDDGKASSVRLSVLLDINNHLGILNYFVGNYEKAIEYYQEVAELNKIRQDKIMNSMLHMNKGESYFGLGQYDLAETELEKALKFSKSFGYLTYTGLIYWDIGKIHEAQGNKIEAERLYKLSVATNIEKDSPDFLGEGYLALANLYKTSGSLDSSYVLAHKALFTYRSMSDSLGLIKAHSTLASLFDAKSQVDSAYYHMKEGATISRTLNREEKLKEFQVIGLNEQLKLKELETEKVLLQSRIRMYGLAAGIGVLLLISIITYRSNLRQRKDKTIIETSYANLKATQTQLIQQEKLASLGQLTAGIAHEIQNPLNFVNNFSEVSEEMLDELKEELEKGDIKEATALANDVKENLQKIPHHGKRADAIVKGMLAHSRSSSGEKVLTDLNVLADEYLRLSYHGLRAKDKSFNADFSIDLDPTLQKVNVVPQDIGRVLLNLINNAFQAVNGVENPKVTVKTRGIKSPSGDLGIQITVSDNGPGIPDSIKDKIFQPFFTTKPTGEGTGLGLSLSYDIVKAHAGELKVESKEGEGSTFIIHLPFSNSIL